ncbi:hypothetical protein Kfla_6962 [Kribbella flavida DSM 17836]|uniref:Uncharacterized protein n=1 Tax=Kribbella flavida (strain DSM 17836 / JCM 10339 / NBRC 14399) TaxID=479435 RepID=D2Q3S8_KRIFD|nr:phosphatidylinositol-specific phospholipase C domain-containing protein [Kribbella flavida]ADB35950.1 hypothetical protein Kfla_6962 [Kribbella flavida DSM 17836]
MKRFVLAAVVALTAAFSLSPTAQAATRADASIAGVTGVGVHNAYVQSTFPWLVDALESGASMLELDIWQNFLGSRAYWVGHDPGNANNCSSATTFAALRSGSRNQSLPACLRNLRLWHDQNPNHAPVILKLELKNGFDGRNGFGPAQFDALLTNALGAGAILRPAEVKGSAATLDAAVRANGWPSRESLRGRFVVLVETGAFEAGNPLDHYDTDLEYADHLISLNAAGNLAGATMFTTVNGASATDPRTGERGGARAPWYVTFDGNASTWYAGSTAFYTANNYLLVMVDAHNVAPAIDARNPTVQQATDRVRQLAAHGATVVSSDWTNPQIVSLTTPRS